MIPISSDTLDLAINILAKAYNNNPGTNLVIGKYGNKKKRLKTLLKYAIYKSSLHKGAFISDDKRGILLFLYPNRSYTTVKLFFWEIIVFLTVIGLRRIIPVIKRERLLKKNHLFKEDYRHLWFLGVDPNFQNKGTGSKLTNQLIAISREDKKPIIVETIEKSRYYTALGFKEYKSVRNSILDYSFLSINFK